MVVFAASGRATIYSFTINHRAAPGFTAPYSIAVVALEEGPRMMTNIIGVLQDPDSIRLDMPVKVVFEQMNDAITLPMFTPVPEAAR